MTSDHEHYASDDDDDPYTARGPSTPTIAGVPTPCKPCQTAGYDRVSLRFDYFGRNGRPMNVTGMRHDG